MLPASHSRTRPDNPRRTHSRRAPNSSSSRHDPIGDPRSEPAHKRRATTIGDGNRSKSRSQPARRHKRPTPPSVSGPDCQSRIGIGGMPRPPDLARRGRAARRCCSRRRDRCNWRSIAVAGAGRHSPEARAAPPAVARRIDRRCSGRRVKSSTISSSRSLEKATASSVTPRAAPAQAALEAARALGRRLGLPTNGKPGRSRTDRRSSAGRCPRHSRRAARSPRRRSSTALARKRGRVGEAVEVVVADGDVGDEQVAPFAPAIRRRRRCGRGTGR